MKQNPVLEIKNNYPFFLKLLQERKIIAEKLISISDTANNHSFLTFKTNVKHYSLTNEISFEVRVHKIVHSKFEFKLLCNDLCKQPFFRYDSYGIAHRVKNEKNPRLKDESVDTPHFNSFDENGNSYAFKTDKLKDVNECLALMDINFGIAHYFFESNTRSEKDEFPTINIHKRNLLFETTTSDPNKNLRFD